MRQKIGYALLGVALLAALLAYVGSRSKNPLIFSPLQTLGALWQTYKKEHVAADFRTVDPARQNDTTSEGQSYTMLRAVWMGDKPSFDSAWQWTQKNLQRQDYLFSWLWGKRTDGSWGVLTAQNGQNTASDADQDIALSLLLAYGRWQDPHYLAAAENSIGSIWKNEVVDVGGKPYLAADNLEKTSSSAEIVVNPSYFDFPAYRLFAKADPAHDWTQLLNDSYDLLVRATDAPLNGPKGVLPPDWVWMNRKTGALGAPEGGTQTTAFGYDALRIPWRLALDYQWSGDVRDLSALSHFSFLTSQWKNNRALAPTYTHAGVPSAQTEIPAMYGGTIGYFILEDQSDARAVYESKLTVLYDPDINSWRTPPSYYDDNWAWFGMALYNQLLPDTTANIPLH